MSSTRQLSKVKPPECYPPEEGRYLRSNDFSPLAAVAILNTFDFKIPQRITNIVRISIETDAALTVTLQTENIGIEKIIANVVANPNIRYISAQWNHGVIFAARLLAH